MSTVFRFILSFVIVCLCAIALPSCLATTGDLDALRASQARFDEKQTETLLDAIEGKKTTEDASRELHNARSASDSDWSERTPQGQNWLALLLGPAAAAAVYGAREIQRRRDLKSVAETDSWVAEVESKVERKAAV